MSFLYVSWDGLGARYLRSLYFPIFAKMGMRVGVLQVGYISEEELRATRKAAIDYGIEYRGKRISSHHSTMLRASLGLSKLIGGVLRANPHYQLVVARSLIPAAGVMALPWLHSRFVFDADGLPADERVDFGGWSRHSAKYRAARLLETAALRTAQVTFTRTDAARRILEARGGRGVLVVPNGSDPTRFVPSTAEEVRRRRAKLGIPCHGIVVVYCGTIGPQYRPDLMTAFLKGLKALGAHPFFIALTPQTEAATTIGREAGLTEEEMLARSVNPEEVADYLAIADVGLAFREPSYSQQAVSPIKVGEYLLCGTPVVANAGVGDLDQIITAEMGVVTTDVTVQGGTDLARRFVRATFDRERIREKAVRSFSIGRAAAGYREAIESAL